MALHKHFEKRFFEALNGSDAIVEIGSARPVDEFESTSTHFLNQMAQETGLTFRSVDMAESANQFSASRLPEGVAVLADGCQFLRDFDGKVGFLYLDNADVLYSPRHHQGFSERYSAMYKGVGRSLEDPVSFNADSAVFHFNQLQAALPVLADHCFVGLDDTFYVPAQRRWWGKGALAAPMLITLGFEIAVENEDGVLFERKGTPAPSVAYLRPDEQ